MVTVTLREVCDMVGISRRTVQGYEQAGLVAVSAGQKSPFRGGKKTPIQDD